MLISPIFCGVHEETPGPGAFDSASFGAGQMKFMASGDLAGVACRPADAEGNPGGSGVAGGTPDGGSERVLPGQTGAVRAADAQEHPLPYALHLDTATHQIIGAGLRGMRSRAAYHLTTRTTTRWTRADKRSRHPRALCKGQPTSRLQCRRHYRTVSCAAARLRVKCRRENLPQQSAKLPCHFFIELHRLAGGPHIFPAIGTEGSEVEEDLPFFRYHYFVGAVSTSGVRAHGAVICLKRSNDSHGWSLPPLSRPNDEQWAWPA